MRTFSSPPMATRASLAPFSMPATRADMATRLETPRMMPSIVSRERNLCAQISRTPARIEMPSCAQNGGALPARPRAPGSHARPGRFAEAAPSSPARVRSTLMAIFPSRISMRRGVTAAISGSWVTSTMVRPSWLSLRNRLRMASPVWESRLPVGSSAKTMRGC